MTVNQLKAQAYQHAQSVASSLKVKKAAKFEKEVERLLRKHGLLPEFRDQNGELIPLTGSPFKTKFFPNIIFDKENGVKQVHQKLTDFWVPKHNLLVECTTSVSDTKEKEFYISKQSVDYDPAQYDYVVFVENHPSDIMRGRIEKAGIDMIVTLPEIEKYIIQKSKEKIKTKVLNIGKIEYYSIDDLVRNIVNREIDWKHVWDLVESILTVLGKSKVQVGLIRPFTAIKVNGVPTLVDAHHLKEAVKIVRDYFGYEIGEVPVMILAHMNDVHPEEVTQLMSSINVIVLNWDNFGYVKSWKTTYELTGNTDSLYPYSKLFDDMVEMSQKLGAKDYSTGGVCLQAYCIEDLESIAKWGENLKNMKTGNLHFDEEHYNSVLLKIKGATLDFLTAINQHSEAMREHPSYRRGGKLVLVQGKKQTEVIDLLTAKANYLRQFATSLKSLYFSNPTTFDKLISKLSIEFWQKIGLPSPVTSNDFQYLDYDDIRDFPKKPAELKAFIEGGYEKIKGIKTYVPGVITKYIKFA